MTRGARAALALVVGCGGGTAPPPGPTEYRPPPEARAGHHGGHAGHREGHGEAHETHGHHHSFEDAEAWAARFEDPSRDAWQRPDVVLDAMGLSASSIVADLGSATGYFAVRVAARVPEGRVWAVDIEPAMVRYLNARARSEGVGNVFSVLGTAADPLLPEPVDVALMVNTYHHVEDRVAYFAGLRGHVRSGGRLVVVDFVMGDLPVGPPDEMKVPVDVMRRELEQAGWVVSSVDETSLPHQLVLVATPAAQPG